MRTLTLRGCSRSWTPGTLWLGKRTFRLCRRCVRPRSSSLRVRHHVESKDADFGIAFPLLPVPGMDPELIAMVLDAKQGDLAQATESLLDMGV